MNRYFVVHDFSLANKWNRLFEFTIKEDSNMQIDTANDEAGDGLGSHRTKAPVRL